MRYLTMGAIFRDENSWLEEWILYHHALGVEHFVLYCDEPDTKVSDRILKPYVDRGLVEIVHRGCSESLRSDPGVRQKNVYRSIIKNMIGNTHWLALVDMDEFVLPRSRDDIREMLEEYEEHSGLAINWALYGSSGHITRPSTQINHFLHRSETNWGPNQYVKSIIKPEHALLDEPDGVHFFTTSRGNTVNENHETVLGISHRISTEKIRINHYVVRSWQDFWEVKAKRPRLGNNPPCDEAYFDYHDRNEVFDDEISRRFGHTIQELN